MVWDETKQVAQDPNNPAPNEQMTYQDWNDMVTDQKSRSKVEYGSGAPTSIPSMIGSIYVDTTNNKKYISIGTSSSTDWKELTNKEDFDSHTADTNNPHNVTAAQVGAITAVSDDTTPSLGGNLNLNAKGIIETLTAGEALVAGDLCYLNTDGKMWKASASAESTCSTLLAIALGSIAADSTGEFLLFGSFGISGLTAGDKLYVSETAGTFTNVAPTTTGTIVRIIGYALSTTRLFFNPDKTYIEN